MRVKYYDFREGVTLYSNGRFHATTLTPTLNDTEVNQIKPSQTKSNQVKPNQTKPNQTKPNQTKPNQTEPNQTKPNQTKPNQTKPNQTKPNQIKPNQIESGSQDDNQLLLGCILFLTRHHLHPATLQLKGNACYDRWARALTPS